MLSVDCLRAGYGRHTVVHDLTIEVKPGEIVSILGANGAGKSTTLRSLSGLTTCLGGSIEFDGRRIERLPADVRARLGLGHVPEGRGILPRLTVTENLRLGMAAARGEASWQERLDDTVALFPQLTKHLRSSAGNLSGGEQQMLAIGRALIGNPKLLMIDEMSFGLAPSITAVLLELITRLRSRGHTFLLVEQDSSVLEVSDRTYVLAGGRVGLQDSSANLRGSGRNRLADVYLGTGVVGADPTSSDNQRRVVP